MDEPRKSRLKQLVQAYAFIGDKSSDRARRIMRLINVLRARRDLRRLEKERASEAEYLARSLIHNSKISGYCSRCNNKGMGIYRHIQRGVCFQCGRMPTP